MLVNNGMLFGTFNLFLVRIFFSEFFQDETFILINETFYLK